MMLFKRTPLTNRYLLFLVSPTLLALSLVAFPKTTYAAYDGGRIIDDSIFLDSTSMDINAIQNHLATNGSGLASMSFKLDCYGQSSKERQWYTAAGAPCDQTVPASNIIYYASQIYGISPKVVLSTLQKEQSLITSPNPTSWQINQAMGYGCPTTGGCGASTFFYQIDSGIWVLRYHFERANGNMNWWTPSTSWTCGTEKNFYKPNLYPRQNVDFYDEDGVHYRTHYIFSAATSSLYCYTPHAYNNPQGLYGRPPFGNVGRYYSGSYNFVYYYELWFGNATGNGYEFVDAINPTPQINPNDVVNARIRIKNRSGTTWYSDGNVPVGQRALRLATFAYESTPYANPSDPAWLGTTNQIKMVESSVPDGATATFNFTFKAPLQNINNYWTRFTPVLDGVSFYPYIGLSFTTFTPTPIYSYSVTESSGVTSNVPTNYTVPVSYTIKNTGNVTWFNDASKPAGSLPLRILTTRPYYRNSLFYDSSTWITPNQIKMTSPRVAPGESSTFVFNIKTPGTAGTYTEQFGLVLDGGIAYPDINQIKFSTNVSDYNYSVISNNIPNNLVPGQKFSSKIVLENTGSATWYADGNTPLNTHSVRLMTPGYGQHPFADKSDSDWLGTSSQVRLSTPSVAPGQTGEFNFDFVVPYTYGSFNSVFQLVLDGVYIVPEFIQRQTTVATISASYSHQPGGIHPSLTAMTKSQTSNGKLIVKNTSNFIWYNDDSKPSQLRGGAVRLVMANPYYRPSPFSSADASWLGTMNQIKMTTAVVSPGENAEFNFTWKAPNQSGTYRERFTLVLDGYALFPDIGMELVSIVN